MAEIFKLDVHRTNCLLEDVFQQTERVRLEVLNNQSNLSTITQGVENTTQTLCKFGKDLEEHRISCEVSQKINEECLRVLANGDLEELEKLRDKLKEQNSGVAQKRKAQP